MGGGMLEGSGRSNIPADRNNAPKRPTAALQPAQAGEFYLN